MAKNTWTVEQSHRSGARYMHGVTDETMRTILGVAKSVWFAPSPSFVLIAETIRTDGSPVQFIFYPEN
jgi:hypothetical protein